MVGNVTAKSHTKHVDIREKYVNEFVFVKSTENDSNILTKNLSGDLYERHPKMMVGEKSELFPRVKKIEDKKKGVIDDVYH